MGVRLFFGLSLDKKNIRTNLLDDHINFVDTTLKQNTCFKKPKFIFVVVVSLFLFVLFKYINEEYFFSTTNIQNS